MGWSIGFDSNLHRDVGYGVPAWCDHPDCTTDIDRGLDYVCGGEPYGGEKGCGLYFCGKHLYLAVAGPLADDPQMCARCCDGLPPYTPKPDHPRWVKHKLTDESWAQWRSEQAEETRS